jgi:hypothetical protein
MKDMFKIGGAMIFFALILLIIGFVGEAVGLYTLPWREDLKREGFQHSRPVVEGHVDQLGKLMAEYNRLEGDSLKNPANAEANEMLQKATVQMMWTHYDAIPADIRLDEVPLDIQNFMFEHPRGAE